MSNRSSTMSSQGSLIAPYRRLHCRRRLAEAQYWSALLAVPPWRDDAFRP